LSTRDAVIQRIGFWAAVLTGLALVGSQFACVKPQALLSTAGFPHASRPARSTAGSATPLGLPAAEAAMDLRASIHWTSPRFAQYQATQTLPAKDRAEGRSQARATE